MYGRLVQYTQEHGDTGPYKHPIFGMGRGATK